MRSLLADILTRLDGLTIDPTELHIDVHEVADPIVTIHFATVADIENYAATDKAKVEVRHVINGRGNANHYEHHALYDRPGRRMLLRCYVFPHSPDWPKDGAA